MFKTEIPELAFADCSSLTSITIPNSIKEIGGGAFMSCSRLAAVNIPDSVKKIGDNAFYSCQSLTSITIPNSVKEIGDDAFGGGYLLVKFDGTQEEWLDIKFKDDWHQGGADNIVFLK